MSRSSRNRALGAWAVVALFVSFGAGPAEPQAAQSRANRPATAPAATPSVRAGVGIEPPSADEVRRAVQGVGLFTLASLAPAAVLMVTAFVRINIVLTLLRQALGSPQVPGNQVLAALALLLTALVMWPVAEDVANRAVIPLGEGKITPVQAWHAASTPVRAFMFRQLDRAGRRDYLDRLQDLAEPPSAGRPTPAPAPDDDYPFRVVATAFLLEELTTALMIGFAVYLPFLVIDLVVSAVLASMGLFMLPPSMIALPLKLILFALADGWMEITAMLIRGFS